MHLPRMNEMIIIEHQDDINRHIGQIIDEQGGHALGWGELRCREQAGRGLARIGKDALQGGGEQVHEDAQLVVVLVKRQPDAGAIDRLHPLGQQCGR